MHIYGFTDFNGFVDLRIFGFDYRFEDFCISKDHLAHKGNFSLPVLSTIYCTQYSYYDIYVMRHVFYIVIQKCNYIEVFF